MLARSGENIGNLPDKNAPNLREVRGVRLPFNGAVSGCVEAVQIHDFGPGGDEVLDELPL